MRGVELIFHFPLFSSEKPAVFAFAKVFTRALLSSGANRPPLQGLICKWRRAATIDKLGPFSNYSQFYTSSSSTATTGEKLDARVIRICRDGNLFSPRRHSSRRHKRNLNIEWKDERDENKFASFMLVQRCTEKHSEKHHRTTNKFNNSCARVIWEPADMAATTLLRRLLLEFCSRFVSIVRDRKKSWRNEKLLTRRPMIINFCKIFKDFHPRKKSLRSFSKFQIKTLRLTDNHQLHRLRKS